MEIEHGTSRLLSSKMLVLIMTTRFYPRASNQWCVNLSTRTLPCRRPIDNCIFSSSPCDRVAILFSINARHHWSLLIGSMGFDWSLYLYMFPYSAKLQHFNISRLIIRMWFLLFSFLWIWSRKIWWGVVQWMKSSKSIGRLLQSAVRKTTYVP